MKLQKYSEWNYNNYFEIVDRRWSEKKSLDKYTRGMAPHKFYFALDSLHYLACFWECEYILWHLHQKSQIASILFQYLHSQRGNGASTMITESIRRHLYKLVPKNDKDVFSSKFIRITSITKMASQWGLDFFESHD